MSAERDFEAWSEEKAKWKAEVKRARQMEKESFDRFEVRSYEITYFYQSSHVGSGLCHFPLTDGRAATSQICQGGRGPVNGNR